MAGNQTEQSTIMATGAPSNALGLDTDNNRIQESSDALKPPDSVASQVMANDPELADYTTQSPQQLSPQDGESAKLGSNSAQLKAKKKPYVNPERVKTGGTQRGKLSEEELGERMLRMRAQNEKIKQRRMDVKADEDAFKKTQESERIKLAQSRKVQEHVNRTREQNARRKMDKVQTREWDSGKPTTGDWKQVKKTSEHANKEEGDHMSPPSVGGRETRVSVRGSPRGTRDQGRSGGQGRSATEGTVNIDKTNAGSEQPSTPAS